MQDIDQTVEEPHGLARSKERTCQDAVQRYQRTRDPSDLVNMITAYDEWAVMTGAPVLEFSNGRPITADDLKALREQQPT